MTFSSIDFFAFLITILTLIHFFRSNKSKKYILLLSSYFFYAYWDYRFLTLIILSSFIDYFVGGRIFHSQSKRRKKKFLYVSLILNLGILGFFKYFNFFILSANRVWGELGINLSTLNIILPVGISFYTFQSMSYSIDIYRSKMKPAKSILDFFIFVSFFPQLIAGPIVRAIDFLPQLDNKIKITSVNIILGSQIFLNGLVKKVVIADNIGIFVDDVFLGPTIYDSLTIWLSIFAYSFQILCDFSGYSDMAIGIARILGFKLPINFNMPYLAKSLTEFWGRWHISLSSWLKDYLYIPLGGNRKGIIRQNLNLIITMLLGGLWHGASWNFVFWGLIHGLGLVIHKNYKKIFMPPDTKLYKKFSWLITYISVCIAWVFFRSQNFNDSIIILNKMFVLQDGVRWLYTPVLFIIPIIFLSHLIGIKLKDEYFIFDLKSFQGAFVLLLTLMCLFFFSSTNQNPFIYFQF